jgi:beta-glucosidase
MKNTRLTALSLFLLIGSTLAFSAGLPIYLDPSKNIEQRVEDALSRMTLEEKVAMCHAQSKFSSKGVPSLGIPEIWMSDGPHGVREEIEWDSWNPAKWSNDYCTAFPALTCLAATFDLNLSLQYGVAIGEEARYREKDILLGPGGNIYRTPLNGRNFEYMGEDPYLASKMIVPYIKGVQKNGVAVSVKHFALNNQEVDRDRVDVEVGDRALREIYLPAFKAAVQEGGAWTIMGSYNKYKGQHCCHNEILLNQILKKEWGFDGVVLSDWGGTHNTKEAALNGLDIEMGSYTNGMTSGTGNAYDNYYLANPFLDMLKKGEIPLSVIDDKARRILRLQMRTNLNSNRPYGRFVCKDHSAVARTVASNGIVLLKNTRNLLPIVPGKYNRIAVIGENATKSLTKGGGSSELKAAYEVSPLEALKSVYGSSVEYAMGYASGSPAYGRELKPSQNTGELFNEALELAKKSDLVLFIGGLNKNHLQDCEGGDRVQFNLPFGQDSLIHKLQIINPNMIVVLIGGNGVAMPWLNQVQALVQSWYLGSESGNALVDVLSGKVNPSGKMPFSIPKKLTDNAAHFYGNQSYPGVNKKQTYFEDIFVGYRWFDTKKIEPQFAFGYGLSYTQFKYGKPVLEKKVFHAKDSITVSLNLKNVGPVDGAEVVQLYVSQNKPSLVRPQKELKAFTKVFLRAGEEKMVKLSVKVSDFAYYNDKLQQWSLENGGYKLMVAAASNDVKNVLDVEISE